MRMLDIGHTVTTVSHTHAPASVVGRLLLQLVQAAQRVRQQRQQVGRGRRRLLRLVRVLQRLVRVAALARRTARLACCATCFCLAIFFFCVYIVIYLEKDKILAWVYSLIDHNFFVFKVGRLGRFLKQSINQS